MCLDIILSIPREVDINIISLIFISTIRSYVKAGSANHIDFLFWIPSNLSVVLRSVGDGANLMVAE